MKAIGDFKDHFGAFGECGNRSSGNEEENNLPVDCYWWIAIKSISPLLTLLLFDIYKKKEVIYESRCAWHRAESAGL